uniref:Uncharacterized protein n=1 Tax=Ralstonia solanacearum TaxID=305 RepID=A0A0S4U4K2_RALSL|nr:protein of unknown function [Ralstonia solanacearum]
MLQYDLILRLRSFGYSQLQALFVQSECSGSAHYEIVPALRRRVEPLRERRKRK